MNQPNKRTKSKIGILLVLLLLIAVNWAGSVWHTRIDLTNEKRFTLSDPTKKMLRNLEAPVIVDVFLKGNFPSGFRKLAGSTADILQEFKEVAGNKVQYNFIAPEDKMEGLNITYGDTLSSLGLYPLNLTSQVKQGQQQQFVFPVALVNYKGQILPIRLYQGKTPLINFQELNSAEAMLEYNLASAIAKVSSKTKPLVGYATGNGEPMGYNVYDMVENILKVDYNLATFNLGTHPVIPAELKALIIVKPTIPFSDNEKLKLDQYVMNGGKLLVFIDRLNAEMDSLQIRNEIVAYDRDLKLNDLFFKYGARVNPDLVMDLQCDYLPFDVNGNGQFELLPWNYFPVLEPGNHTVIKNLGFVAGRFINSIDTVGAEGIKKTILLSSSVNARTIATPALISPRENVNAAEDVKFKKANIPVAVLLEGKFQSLYANRLSVAMKDSLQQYGAMFLPGNISDNKIIIISDGDIVLNAVVKGNQPIAMGMNQYTYGSQREFPFANKDFFQNCLDYLINENNLGEAKAKEYVARLLDTKKVNEEMNQWQAINIGLPVIIVILFAVIFQYYRRRKYAV